LLRCAAFSALTLCFGFGLQAQIVITEIMYNPAGNGTDNAEEFIEIANVSFAEVDISGYTVKDSGPGYTFPEGSTIASGEAIVVARTPATYPGSIGPASISLNNGGEILFIEDADGNEVDVVSYNDDIGADDDGNTLQVLDGTMDNANTNNGNWVAAAPTPGVYNGPLPVTLTAFTAEAQPMGNVLVEWATASELDSDYFEVEVSRDATNFLPTARIASAGTTDEAMDYSYVFEGADEPGDYYFRLRQVDFNGDFEIFNVVHVSIGEVVPSLRMLSGVVDGTLNVSVTHAGNIVVLNTIGGVVSSTQVTDAGPVALDVSTLPRGLYLVSDGERTLRFFR